jgi:pyruvate kinase
MRQVQHEPEDEFRSDEFRTLLAELIALRQDVTTLGLSQHEEWRPWIVRPAFNDSARNLANYLALRGRDLRPLQRRLMALGLSSLGRSEARVVPNLDALIACLAGLANVPTAKATRMPSRAEFFHGEDVLAHNAARIFGTQDRSRILATLDLQAANDPEFVLGLAKQGVDAVRINCGHDDLGAWQEMVRNVRKAEESMNRKIPILMDIAGPKLRIDSVAASASDLRLKSGDEMLLCRQLPATYQESMVAVTCEPASILDNLDVGDSVSLDDGNLRGRIVRMSADGMVVRFDKGRLKGVKIKPDKGINFPGVALEIDPLTEKDRRDLDFVCSHADMVGYSFVETADHIAQLQQELSARRTDWRNLTVIAKIETPRAVQNLPEIIVRAAGQQPLGVMIARGDLAVEMGFTRLAEMQEEILWICEAAHIPAIWATQVLEDLVKEGLPSRGEMTDAAMAGRAECVMLNKGPNVLEAVAVLDKLLRRMAEHQVKKTPQLRMLHSWADELPAHRE